MNSVTIIGAGAIGSAVAAIAVKSGATVQILTPDLQEAASVAQRVGAESGTVGDEISGDVVILAVPYSALSALADTYRGQFEGKVVVETTNPVDAKTFDGLMVPPDSSATAELQAQLPGARVLKAFNTNFAATLSTGRTGDAPLTVLVAGDDESARQSVIDLVHAAGLEATSAGSLKRARELEAIGFMQMVLAAQEVISWNGGFALRR